MQGLYAVFKKELQDHLSSYRFVILFALIAMVSFITSYMAAVHMRENLEGLARSDVFHGPVCGIFRPPYRPDPGL